MLYSAATIGTIYDCVFREYLMTRHLAHRPYDTPTGELCLPS